MTKLYPTGRPALLLAAGAAALIASPAFAAIPADYTGKPYMDKPQAIPGRVELANLDIGGEGVSYHADHRRANAEREGYAPLSGDDYRPTERDLPNICKTNGQSTDTFVDGSPFPPPPDRSWYYMGFAHAGDYVKLTVDVKQAGTYNLSSHWAVEGGTWALSIWFNDGSVPGGPKDGINKTGIVEMPGTNSYHKWKWYPNFAKVTLTAGLQVMMFRVEKHPHLQYGYVQFDLADGGASDAGASDAAKPATDAGAAATGGTTGAGTGGSTGSGGGSGTAGAGMTGGTGAGGTTTSTGGSSGSASGGTAGGNSGGSSGGSSPAKGGGSSGGCALASGSQGGSAIWAIALLVIGLAARTRRRRS